MYKFYTSGGGVGRGEGGGVHPYLSHISMCYPQMVRFLSHFGRSSGLINVYHYDLKLSMFTC